MIRQCLIIDDEEIARAHLRNHLAAFSADVRIIGEAANGLEAVERIEKLKPDLLFLDVQMPGLNGFEVIRKLVSAPMVIFTTAYDEYALEAFRVNAVDYLLKPVSGEDLSRAIDKIRRHTLETPFDLNAAVESILAKMKSNVMTRVKVTVGDSLKFVPVDKIMYFEADEKYTTLCSESGMFLIETPLADLEQRLPAGEFVRIHRRHIVNVNYISEMKKWFDRKLKLKLRGCEKKEFVVSRNFVDRIKEL
jgi:two-component system LytT family response regulator